MIFVQNLRKIFKENKVALDDVSFTLNEGDICGYIGTNGAGKSTTIKILCGGLDFDSGKVELNGFDVLTNAIDVKNICGYVPENSNMFNQLTSFEFLEFIAKVRNIDEIIYKKRIEYFSEILDFNDLLNSPIGILSKGNKQKILITSALLHNPDILLLDEPLNGLDANTIIIFQDIIKTLSTKGKIIFYCSHLLDIIEKISNRIIILENGKIILDETTNNLNKKNNFHSLEGLFRNMNENKRILKFDYDEAFLD